MVGAATHASPARRGIADQALIADFSALCTRLRTTPRNLDEAGGWRLGLGLGRMTLQP
jgi:hypothetical protein